MACVTSCPSGVRYDALIESTRAKVEREYRRPRGERWRRTALFSVLPYHRRLRPAAYALALRLPAPKIAPRLKLSAIRQRPPARTPAAGEPRMKVAMLLGCVQRAFFGDVNAATARVLAAYGCEVLAPRDQGCCGALELHAGRAPAERRRTRAARPPRRARRRPDRRQQRRLRLGAEGGRPPGCGARAGCPRGARGARAAAAARAAARPARGVPRRLPPRARPGCAGGAARRAGGDPGRRAAGGARRGDLLRLGGGLQPAGARPGERPRPPGRQRPSTRSPPT